MAESLALIPVKILVGKLIDKAISTVTHHVSLVVNVREEVKFLRGILPEVKDLVLNVTDHDVRDHKVSETTKSFLRALRDFVYDAEDILDEFDTEISRRRWKKNRRAPSSNDFPGGDERTYQLSPMLRLKIGKKIKGLYKKLLKIKNVRQRIDELFAFVKSSGLQDITSNTLVKPNDDELVATDFRMIGREDVKRKIIDKLLKVTCRTPEAGRTCSDSEACPDCLCRPVVLLITGMGGLGKTTLAQEVLRDTQIIEYFDFTKWVSVGDGELDPKEVMGKIISKDRNVDKKEVQRELEGKKFLIVLDDVWKGENLQESWKQLRDPLSYGGSGSRVIITTREENVKNELIVHGKVEVERLDQLGDEECMQIFERRAFPLYGDPINESLKEQLMEIGRQIVVKKIKGVPLAAEIIGSSLSNEREERLWKSAFEQIGVAKVDKATLWSYRRLPSHLKQCFIYLSLFPKDSKLKRMEIERMWIAHGYVVKPDNCTYNLEDIAGSYFDYLVKVSLIQFVRNEYGGECCYTLHDLVHDFATRAYEGVYYTNPSPLSRFASDHILQLLNVGDFTTIRHMSAGYYYLPKKYKNTNKLRTLLWGRCSGEYRFKTARVIAVDFFPLFSISRDMMHLRYLDFSRYSYGDNSLPESLCSLYNLQTLILPCFLEKHPKNMWKLVNLRHLHKPDLTSKDMPIINRIEDLTSLQTINGIQLSEKNMGKDIRVLHRLPQPGQSLRISGLKFLQDSGDARYARLEEKKYVQELCLDMTADSFDPFEPISQNEETQCKDVLDNLKPHHNLQKLEIRNYYGRELPTWFGDGYLCNLKTLDFWKLSSSLEKIPPLGLLPKLAGLKMSDCDIKRIGNEIYGGSVEAVFPSLKEISLQYMYQLEEWEEVNSEDKGGLINKYFPSLEEIFVHYCPKLRWLPHVPASLKTLEIWNSGITALPKVWGRDDSTANTRSLPHLGLSISDCPNLVRR